MRPWSFALALVSLVACSESSSSPSTSTPDGGQTADAGGPNATTCEQTRSFVLSCGGDLNCGPDKFDAWCKANDQAINSEAYRRAEAECLVPASCTGDARKRCEYARYGKETPTAAQSALVEAFCQTCESGDVEGCKSRSVAYDPAAGPDAVGDIFVAAWELSDGLCDAIRTQCTGASFDAGADCVKAFGSCAGDVYLNAVPDCP